MKGLKRRLGVLQLSENLFDLMSLEEISLLFGNFYPTHINRDHPRRVEYYGHSEHFEEIEVGTEIPRYIAVINSTDKTISFERS